MGEKVATGSFDVKLEMTSTADAMVGVMSIAKTFHGDLKASSIGQMLAIGTLVKGSAGYVAMERVTGTLGGRDGTFALQHSGTMNKGDASLIVSVVPGSGTEGLEGLDGVMEIVNEGGRHDYIFRYSRPE